MNLTSKKKILIVDNDVDNFKELEQKLIQYPFEVIKCSSGNKSFNIAKKEKPDLILATAQLTDMDGFDLCWMIRQSPEINTIPYILVSDNANPEERINAYRSGVDAFITSDTSIREIYTIIETKIKRIHQLKNTTSNSQASFQGKMPHFSVIEIIQMLNISKKSGTLTFSSNDRIGKLGFWDGRLAWAEADDFAGNDAVKKIVFWEHGSFVFEKDLIHPIKNIHSSTMQLILDCCQLLDEKNGQQ